MLASLMLFLVYLFCLDVSVSGQVDKELPELSAWLSRMSGHQFESLPGVSNVKMSSEALISNVDFSADVNDDDDEDVVVTDNFFFEKGRYDSEGRMSGFGTLYIFDKLEGILALTVSCQRFFCSTFCSGLCCALDLRNPLQEHWMGLIFGVYCSQTKQ